MLSLVRSQKACIERLRSAVRWGRGLVLLVGDPEAGKTAVIDGLIIDSPYLPLRLDGRVIADKHDAILRLVALVGLKPGESDLLMLERLQSKQFIGIDSGVPEIIIDQAEALSPEVIRLFHELSFGIYGRQWSILLVGQINLVNSVLSIMRTGFIPSIVSLPCWDIYDLREAALSQNPDFEVDEYSLSLLSRYSGRPRSLLHALGEVSEKKKSDPRSRNPPPERDSRLRDGKFIIAIAIGLAALLAAFLILQLEHDEPQKSESQTITIKRVP